MAPLAAASTLSHLTSPHSSFAVGQQQPYSSFARAPLPLAGGSSLRTQQLSTSCSASGASSGSPQPRPRGRPAGAGSSRAASSAASDGLQRLKGVGPANEEKLRKSKIVRVPDLQAIYVNQCLRDVEQLTDYLQSHVGIRRLHGKLIAQEIEGLVAAAEQAAEAAAADMVTLAVEGNISAGKSTFLDVLSHERTNLRDILKVIQEPVQQWQAFECVDRQGRRKEENVLQKFYSDPDRFAYSFQHYVLMSRMQQDRASRRYEAGKHLRVIERSIFSDRQVFVRAMHSQGKMEDFEVKVYNDIFDEKLREDVQLVPDGFVYLKAGPDTCLERLKRRNRSEETNVNRAYLEMLHHNHEDWLSNGESARGILQRLGGASVLTPASEAAVQDFMRRYTPGEEVDQWKLELIENVPEPIKDQVLLLKGADGLPALRHRLALVLDHDQDVDIHRDTAARQEYAGKIQAFYDFVKQWKAREAAETNALHELQAQLKASLRDGRELYFDDLGNVMMPAVGGQAQYRAMQMSL